MLDHTVSGGHLLAPVAEKMLDLVSAAALSGHLSSRKSSFCRFSHLVIILLLLKAHEVIASDLTIPGHDLCFIISFSTFWFFRFLLWQWLLVLYHKVLLQWVVMLIKVLVLRILKILFVRALLIFILLILVIGGWAFTEHVHACCKLAGTW